MARKIVLKNVTVHNLKGANLELDPNQLIVFTGVSGSGKTSLAFDTIYVEGQRRYIESLSTFARRHLGEMPRPDAELIDGISPTIAIEQKTAGKNPRSTVGTMTGIYDFLRILYARIGIAHCPVSGEVVTPQSTEQILRQIHKLPEGAKIVILAPYAQGKKGEFKDELSELLRKGYTRIRLDTEILDLDQKISIDGKVAHDLDLVIDRMVVKDSERGRLAESITQGLEAGGGQVKVLHVEKGREQLFSEHAYSPKSGLSYGPLQPRDFSFNHPLGMCEECQGIGTLLEFDLDKIIDPDKSIADDCCSVASSYKTVRFGNIYNNLAEMHGFSIKTPWKKLPRAAKQLFLHGSPEKWIKMQFTHPEKKRPWTEYVQWKGVLHEARRRYQEASSDVYRNKMEKLMDLSSCPKCEGGRIRPYPAATKLAGVTLHQLTSMSIGDALTFFDQLELTSEEKVIADEVVKEVRQRLFFLSDVGLHYLTLERTAPTLSGGEAQRVRLASQIGSGLSKATYVLDEPSIGLHPRDNTKLLASLRALCDKGNTVIVVEHDEETILAADHIVDVGPLAGKCGGEVIVSGSLSDLLKSKRSITADYLSGKRKITIPKKRRTGCNRAIEIVKAHHHNLKEVSCKIPLEKFIAVTGVSGSGKSSLITDILYPALSNHHHSAKMKVGKHKAIKGLDTVDKVIAIDQSPIGRTPRSNPSTYIKLFDHIRDLFAELPESQAQGYRPGRFSFNVKEGSCPHCSGMGMIRVDMDFMDDEWTTCKHCEGRRFDIKTLSVLYKGKSIYEVLEMTINDASEFFDAIPPIKKKLSMLQEVGLGYLKLGQSSPTLSGGEAQRIKLAKELSRPSTGSTLYILDEPTTGLHFHDIHKLVEVLQKLVDKRNTVLVIEHNMDLVKTCDWIIDLGPEGGSGGGEIIATGKPEKIAKMETPTGRAIHHALYPTPIVAAQAHKSNSQCDSVLHVEKAEQNNLAGFDVTIAHGEITVCTGPSGSGKSSLAFETIYAEGQRRYTESMSPYARQYVKQMPKPKVEAMDGLLASIAIEQKSHAGNPRSTIGTMTESYDYLRVLYAHQGVAYCPETGEQIESISKEFVLDKVMALPEKTKVQILAPLDFKEGFDTLKEKLLREGFLRIRLNGENYELDGEIPFDRRRKNAVYLIVDRLTVSAQSKKRIYDAIDTAAKIAKNTLITHIDGKDTFYNLAFAVPSTGKSYPPITPHTFQFNTASGMCMDCLGLGYQYGASLQGHRAIMRLSPYALLKRIWKDHANWINLRLLEKVLNHLGIDPETPLEKLSPQQLQLILGGTDTPLKEKEHTLTFRGIGPVFAELAKSATTSLKEELTPWVNHISCPSCKGTRLNPLARNVKLEGLSISELCALPIGDAAKFIDHLPLKDQLLKETLAQLKHRLEFLNQIGLDYLSLDRAAPTLSGGETQRIRLARQLGSWLTGCLYVLDEPTIGLHPHNNALLNHSLKQLCKQGNTLLLVEHDPLTIEIADKIIDFGPGAGKYGGQIMAQGTLEQIKKNPNSLTGAYLSGSKQIPTPKKRREGRGTFSLENACLHNLKNLSFTIPVGAISCFTGVSGSGKSTLMNDLIRPAVKQALARRKSPDTITYAGCTISGISVFDKLLVIDQNPIGTTARADVSTYTDLSTPLRYHMAQLPEAHARGLKPKHFSHNHLSGMCTKCWGLGKRKIEMQFLPPIRVTCEACNGHRLKPLSLQVKTRGMHLGQMLELSVEEALEKLPPIPKLLTILKTLVSVGLGYLTLGQEVATLSGGEAQRLRLARELAKSSRGKTLYLFDEPTIGLHSEDILKLLKIFHTLVDEGNTVLMIEHNLEVIKNADYLIDIGPLAGSRGGQLVCAGTPEQIVDHPTSLTARYLKPILN